MGKVPKKKPRPAKDMKEGDLRKKYAEGRKTKANKGPSGTLQEKMQEARTRPYKGAKGGAVTKVEKPRMTGRQYSGDTIRMKGPQRGVDTFRPVPLSDKKLALEGPKSAAQAAARSVGSAALKGASLTAAFALSPSTFSYKTGGEAQAPAPKKGEKLMRGMTQVGYGSKTTSADYGYTPKAKVKAKIPARGESRGGMKSTLESYRQSKAGGTGNSKTVNPYKAPVSMAGEVPIPKAKPRDKAFTLGTGAQTPKKKVSVSPPQRPKFKGNWVGAAPTEMQKRGGAKIKRPNLLSLLRKKKG